MTGKTSDIEEIREILSEVVDPCSAYTDRPTSIIDLGLVEEITVNDQEVEIILVLEPFCMYLPHIKREINARLSNALHITEVNVKQSTDKFWTPPRMKLEETTAREERLSEELHEEGIKPWYGSD